MPRNHTEGWLYQQRDINVLLPPSQLLVTFLRLVLTIFHYMPAQIPNTITEAGEQRHYHLAVDSELSLLTLLLDVAAGVPMAVVAFGVALC